MKIIFLNAWQGNIPQIKDFVLEHKTDTDVFCFQESYLENKPQIFCIDYLDDFQLFFDKKFVAEKDHFEQSTFIKKNLIVTKQHTIGQNNPKIGLGIYTQIKFPKFSLHLCNFHGFARPGDKQDTPDRLFQSDQIIDFFKNISGPKIIGGDFNLDIDTQSVKKFEDNGYRNLIKDFNVTTTRNHFSWDRYPQKQYFADHLFVSPDVKVNNFSVPYNEVSDHLPLVLEFKV